MPAAARKLCGLASRKPRRPGVLHRVVRPAGQPVAARGPVEERDPEEEERRAERAHDEVLQARLERRRARAVVADEDVQPHRHRLQRHEEHHEVAALDEQHHRRRDDEDDVVELHDAGRAACGGPVREDRDKEGREEEEDPHHLAPGREDEEAVEAVLTGMSRRPSRTARMASWPATETAGMRPCWDFGSTVSRTRRKRARQPSESSGQIAPQALPCRRPERGALEAGGKDPWGGLGLGLPAGHGGRRRPPGPG
jgi:hypothetical protein